MYIIDFEASSLSKNSFPIEVAWGRCRNTVKVYLLNPSLMEGWDDWDIRSEQIHRIKKKELLLNGTNPSIVAKKMIGELAGQDVYSDEPTFDNMWKNRLLYDSGYDTRLIRIKDLKRYMANLINTHFHHREFINRLKQFDCDNETKHRAKSDVIWLFDLLTYLTQGHC